MTSSTAAHEARPPGRRPAGGPALQDTVTDALASAFFEELAETGYGRLSLEAVAKRAGAGKAAIYRRWPSKQAMTLDLVARIAVDGELIPDTGSLRGDVRSFLDQAAAALDHPLAARIIPDLLAVAVREPELAQGARDTVGAGRRRQALVLLERAIARDELPSDLDLPLALDLLIGPLYWHLAVAGEPAGPDVLDTLTDMLIGAFCAGRARTDGRPRPEGS